MKRTYPARLLSRDRHPLVVDVDGISEGVQVDHLVRRLREDRISERTLGVLGKRQNALAHSLSVPSRNTGYK